MDMQISFEVQCALVIRIVSCDGLPDIYPNPATLASTAYHRTSPDHMTLSFFHFGRRRVSWDYMKEPKGFMTNAPAEHPSSLRCYDRTLEIGGRQVSRPCLDKIESYPNFLQPEVDG
jgi:hypothetical protein